MPLYLLVMTGVSLVCKPTAISLWIGSNRGLFRYYRQTKTMKRYRYSSHREGMLSQAYITDMKLTSGAVWWFPLSTV